MGLVNQQLWPMEYEWKCCCASSEPRLQIGVFSFTPPDLPPYIIRTICHSQWDEKIHGADWNPACSLEAILAEPS